MATYLKRSTKLFERLSTVSGSRTRSSAASAAEPTLRELICPVCRTLLREPVTLPCAHNLCLRCLRGTVEHSNLSCPLCRQRVGSWLRRSKPESLVNRELWQLIRRRYPQEVLAEEGPPLAATEELSLDPEFNPKKILSEVGEIRKEYEIQLQKAEEEMRQQRDKERIASEALIQKIQQEEEQQKLVQLAQDQLLAKTLAKQERPNKAIPLTNSEKSKFDVNQSKLSTNPKMSVKSKDATDARKQNTALASKNRSERHTLSVKSSTYVQKETLETFSSQKPVPIHNAVTRVVTHQSRINPPFSFSNSTYSAALGELIGSTSKIYGLQSKEELHVPSDVLSSKKKKLGVEVCVTTVEGGERIGSAESAGSHDSINQEIHHFKPIKALPRTPLRTALDGKQIDPKLIRVLPILKRVANAVPKPPTPTHLKKIFGCSWSAFKRISWHEQLMHEDSSSCHQQKETKKTELRSEQSRNASKSRKTLQDVDERSFDSNKNYAKNINKIINGTKVSKKLNLDEQTDSVVGSSTFKSNKRAGKLKNGLLPGKHKSPKAPIEVVDLDDDENETAAVGNSTPDPLAFTPKCENRRESPMLELAMENIAERIKRRKTQRTASNTENVQSAINLVESIEQTTKVKSKKTSTKSRKQKIKKTTPPSKPKVKTVTVTSQIKKLAARSTKRPRYTEDSESEEEYERRHREEMEASEEQKKLEANEVAELDRSNPGEVTPSLSTSPSPSKKPRKAPKSNKKKKASKRTVASVKDILSPVKRPPSPTFNSQSSEEDDTGIIQEQGRIERLAAQEREDRELALRLQASFNAMERIAGRTRRGAAARIPSPLLGEASQRRPQKRTAMN